MGRRVLILGGDGYLGWPTAMAFSRAGDRVAVVDNFAKRQWEVELGVQPLFQIQTLHERLRAWREVSENEIELRVGDLTDYGFVEALIDEFRPDTIVHYSHNIHFATRVWDLRATDLNQGVVYGVETDESALDPRLATSFHYDEVFGTALNRFCVQAVIGHPLTVYGKGGQTRGYLNIRDTVACVALAAANPADPGELRIYNQFTEQFSVQEVAERVEVAAGHLGWKVEIEHTENPRKE